MTCVENCVLQEAAACMHPWGMSTIDMRDEDGGSATESSKIIARNQYSCCIPTCVRLDVGSMPSGRVHFEGSIHQHPELAGHWIQLSTTGAYDFWRFLCACVLVCQTYKVSAWVLISMCLFWYWVCVCLRKCVFINSTTHKLFTTAAS